MRILAIHNYYQQRGGEDRVFAAECRLLREHGHHVCTHTDHNSRLQDVSAVAAAIDTVWSNRSYRLLTHLLEQQKPDIVHFHNTLLRISPSAYYACQNAGIPVVQTLHNYRLLCPAATLFRAGRVCEDCLNRTFAWPGVVHGCWRNSRAQTSVLATMLAVHGLGGTWRQAVAFFIALTDFARQKFIEGGLPADSIVVKPNFARPLPATPRPRERFALFIGRLSPEKGIDVMLDAWTRFGIDVPLKIAGSGPLERVVAMRSTTNPLLDYLGPISPEEVADLMLRASVLVFPSVWYEGFPLVIAEAYSAGLPVVASRLGSMNSIVEDRRTGLHFDHADASDLARAVQTLVDDPQLLDGMRAQVRSVFCESYTPESNYRRLIDIYHRAIDRRTVARRVR